MIRPMLARVALVLTNSKPKYENPFSRKDFFLSINFITPQLTTLRRWCFLPGLSPKKRIAMQLSQLQ